MSTNNGGLKGPITSNFDAFFAPFAREAGNMAEATTITVLKLTVNIANRCLGMCYTGASIAAMGAGVYLVLRSLDKEVKKEDSSIVASTKKILAFVGGPSAFGGLSLLSIGGYCFFRGTRPCL